MQLTSITFQALNGLGVVPGARLFSYAAGTLTPQATYTRADLAEPNTNPVVCDAAGQAAVWMDPTKTYRFRLETPYGGLIADRDNIAGDSSSVTSATLAAPSGAGLIGVDSTNDYSPGTIGSRLGLSVSPTDAPWLADMTGGLDSTAAFQSCFSWAAANNCPVFVPAGSFLLNGSTITIPPNLEIECDTGASLIVTSWTAKSATTDQGLTAQTLFICTGGGTDYTAVNSFFRWSGGALINRSTTPTNTRVFCAFAVFDSIVVERARFGGFSVVGAFGIGPVTTGVHPGSDAQTAINTFTATRNRITSDAVATAQCPKGFHVYHCADGESSWNRIIANGDGYLTRFVGGSFDTIPAPTRGCGNIRIAHNFYRPLSTSEYNQCAKCFTVSVVGDQAMAALAPGPDNMWDFFNCMNVTFNGNTAVGGGLAFFGHADLNGSAYPSDLRGSRGFSAAGNTIFNPTHNSIFNLGGDGDVNGNRAGHNATITGTTVSFTPGFTPPASAQTPSGQAFLYSFIFNDITLSDNIVEGVSTFIHSYFCNGINVGSGNTLVNVPTAVYFEGTDYLSQPTHAYDVVNYRGTAGTINTIETLNPGYMRDFKCGVGALNLTGQRVAAGFGVSKVAVFNKYDLSSTTSEALVYKITATHALALGDQGVAVWYVHKSGTVVRVVPATSGNDTALTCSFVSPYVQVAVNNTTAASLNATMIEEQ